ARDYASKLVGEEKLQDADRRERECWHVDMSAATPEALYSRIEFWIERGTYRSVKGKFYSDSGRLLKIAYYRKYEPQLGTPRPTETVIIDAVDSNLVTISTTSDYRYQAMPEAWFQRGSLPRLKLDLTVMRSSVIAGLIMALAFGARAQENKDLERIPEVVPAQPAEGPPDAAKPRTARSGRLYVEDALTLSAR